MPLKRDIRSPPAEEAIGAARTAEELRVDVAHTVAARHGPSGESRNDDMQLREGFLEPPPLRLRVVMP